MILFPCRLYAENAPANEATLAGEAAEPAPTKDKPTPRVKPPKGGEGATQTALMSAEGSAGGNFLSMPALATSLFTGAATMSIPIETPPGRLNLAPSLALNYNSYGGNGWIGLGWTIDMGAIQRATKFGVKYNTNDFVAIVNGSAAELVSRGGSLYAAKIEGAFSKYEFISPTSGWKVTAKNGTKYYYGQTALSRQDFNNGQDVFKWCLNRVEDTNGNYLTVTYTKDQGEIYLDKIDYTGPSPSNSVKFHLQDGRLDVPLMFTPNYQVKTAKLLKTIEIKANTGTQPVRAYTFEYVQNGSASTGRSLLKKVQMYGSDAYVDPDTGTITPLPPPVGLPPLPTTIWSDEGRTHTLTSENPYYTNDAFNWGPSGWSYGDFNGDNKTDIIYHTSTPYLKRVKLSNGNGAFTDGPAFYTYDLYSNDYRSFGPWWSLGDVNGDGKSDIVYLTLDPYAWTTKFSNGDGTFTDGPPFYINDPYTYYPEDWAPAYWGTGDFNGDGKKDIIYFSNSYAWRVKFSNGDGTFTDDGPLVYANDAWSYTSTYWTYGDFNGDGKTDIIYYTATPYVWKIKFSNGDGTFTAGTAFSTTDAAGWGPAYWDYGDFNGDGKTDIVYRTNTNANRIKFSKGDGSFTNTDVAPFSTDGLYAVDPRYWSYGDFNGDGKTDIIYRTTATNTSKIKFSKGDGSFTDGQPIYTADLYGWELGYVNYRDFNGDGKTDIDYLTTTSYARRILSSVASLDLPLQVTNPIGGQTYISYESSSAYQNAIMPFVLQVVKSISIFDGINYNPPQYATHYEYSGGNYNFPERDFRGFSYVKQTNPDLTKVETWFRQDNEFKGLMSEQVIKSAAGSTYTQTNNTYLSSEPYPGYSNCKFPYLRLTANKIFEGTTNFIQSSVLFNYDNYGNVTRKESSGNGVPVRIEETVYTYDTTNWIVSLPEHTYVKDGSSVKAETAFTYYPGTANLWTKDDWLSGAPYRKTTFTYYPNGNLQTTKDANNNETTITAYDATSTYPTAVSYPHGLATSKTYDVGHGKPLTERDFNGTAYNYNTATYQYDAFGRLKVVTNPFDQPTTFYYENFGQVGAQRTATHARDESPPEYFLWKETYFDGFGRTIKTRTEGPDTPAVRYIVTQTAYNTMGRVSSSSLPYFENNETPLWVSYEYDALGRITRVTYPTEPATFVQRSYALGATTPVLTTVLIDANGHRREEDRDLYGRLVTVREYNEGPVYTTTYQYDLLNNLLQVTDAAGNNTYMVYDTLSRKTSMNDPDMGAWSYGYDANGNLTSQTDAKNKTITFQYDGLNRLKKKLYPTNPVVIPDVLYFYDWDDPNYYNKGRLTTVCNGNSQTEVCDNSVASQFYYDKLGRTVKTEKTVDFSIWMTRTSYDPMSRIKSITYDADTPSSEIVYYAYDAGSNLCYVGNTQTATCQTGGYASYSGYNAAGQPGRVTYGNGVVTDYTYETATMRLKTMQTTVLNGGGTNYERTHALYNWVTANNPTGITGDDQYAGFSLPFTFNFYGTNFTQAYFSSNGFASFGGGSADYTPDPIPSTNVPNGLAAGLWRDLYPPAGGCTGAACITYGSSGGQFAVSYNNVRNYSGASRQTFQIVLNSDGNIVNQYAAITNDVPTSIGVENQTGTQGTAYGSPRNGLAIKFTPVIGGTVAQDIEYTYDNAGNIRVITDKVNGNRTQNFLYDDLNRLKQADSGAYGTINYTYNAIGNMLSNSQVSTGNYVYDDPAHRHAVTSIPGFGTYHYDANGNMDIRNGTPMEYDYDNRLKKINNGAITFVYDHAGQRVKKNTTVYRGQLSECTGGICTKYIFAGGRRIVSKVSSGQTYYYHPDHLGGSSVITDNTGTKVEELHYYPFGDTRSDAGSVSLKHKYTGQELDPEYGLYYYGARYYDPTIGRFISADTIVQAPGDPQTLNRYSYVRNNPLIYVDPSGNIAIVDDILIGAAIGALVGGTISAFTGGDVLQGIVTGAISGGFFGGAGWYIGANGLTGVTAAGLHAGAGAISGGINAGIYGGDVGLGALIGGASAGFAEYAGGQLFGEGGFFANMLQPGSAGEFAVQLAGTSMIGGITGGAAEVMYGGDFGNGFTMGATTAAIGYFANNAAHKVIKTVKGEVSTYDISFAGKETCIGEIYDPQGMTGAARQEYMTKATMRKGVYATFSAEGINSQTVTINDRLSSDPRFKNRVLDVTNKAMSQAKGVGYTTDSNALGIVKNATVIYWKRW